MRLKTEVYNFKNNLLNQISNTLHLALCPFSYFTVKGWDIVQIEIKICQVSDNFKNQIYQIHVYHIGHWVVAFPSETVFLQFPEVYIYYTLIWL